MKVANTVQVMACRPSLKTIKCNSMSGKNKEPRLPPTERVYRRFVKYRHKNDATAAARHHDNLHQFAFLLEVLRHHDRRTVARDVDADADNHA